MSSPAEQAQVMDVDQRKKAYLAVRSELFRLKDLGKTQELAELADSRLESSFKACTGALGALLEYQTQQSNRVEMESARQYIASRNLMIGIGLGLAALMMCCALAWALTRSIAVPLREAVSLIERIAGGDLRPAARQERTDETGRLLAALGAMTTRLAETVGTVREGAVAMDVASSEIAAGDGDLSRRTEQQASALEETACAVEQLTATVKQNSVNAAEADALAKQASQVASKGGKVVADVVDTMLAISVLQEDRGHHGGHRRYRFPDQFAGPECGSGSGPRR